MDVIIILLSIIAILATLAFSAFYRLSPMTWSVLIGIVLFLVSIWGGFSTGILLILWILFLAAVLLTHLTQLRQLYIVKPMLKSLRAKLPPISVTEKEAIEAGNTWWEKDLFNGDPNWDKLFKLPKPQLTKEEEDFLNNQVEHVCSLLKDWDIVSVEKKIPDKIWEYMKAEKFLALCIPKTYGGLGFSALFHSAVIIKIASRSPSAAVSAMVPNSLGPAELLLYYGTEEQKSYYLPRLADGREVPCFALTAPDAGSDAGSIQDNGIVCRGQHEGKEVLGIRLTWDKRYITLAPIATLLGIAFHLYDPDHLIGDQLDVGITLCLIPTSHPGVEIGTRHYPLYQAFLNGPTRGKDVFIPMDWLIGGSQSAGKGWHMLMECLSIGRSISLPGLATACQKVAYRYTGAYTRIRKQFKLPIAAFEGVEEALSTIAGYCYITEAARIMTASAVDLKIKPATPSAITKYHLTEMSRISANRAMDVHGGHTIQVGPRNFLASLFINQPISITVEGANILTRNLIIFGQGAIRCHPYLLKEVNLISSESPDIQALDKVLMSHIGFFVSNVIKNLVYGLTGGKLISVSTIRNRDVKKYQKQLTRMSAALAMLSDTSLILLGGSLKRREYVSARLGDILSQLYLASSVLKYFHNHDEPASDIYYVCWSLQCCLSKIQNACDKLLDNFPNLFLGKLLKIIIFPYGRAYKRPSDKLSHKIVKSMLSPSPFRDRLTQYCYISNSPDELTYRLEKALPQIPTVEPIAKKLNNAVKGGRVPEYFNFVDRVKVAKEIGDLTEDEAKTLIEFEELKNEIIKVNEFSFDFSKVIA